MTPNRFYNWVRDETTAERIMYIGGSIASEQWFDDDVTPDNFRAELYADKGPISIYVNSMGGDVVAASQIYNMLIEFPWDVTIKIDGIAASAASVIAMAGTRVLMAPTAGLLIHDPETLAVGNANEMRRTVQTLDEVKESIINAYQLRTNLSRTVLWNMMERAEYMNAYRAIELKFADAIITDTKRVVYDNAPHSFSMRALIGPNYRNRAMCNIQCDGHQIAPPVEPPQPTTIRTEPIHPTGIPIEPLTQRLLSLSH